MPQTEWWLPVLGKLSYCLSEHNMYITDDNSSTVIKKSWLQKKNGWS